MAGIRPVLTPVLLAILMGKMYARRRGLALVGGAAAAMLVWCIISQLLADSFPLVPPGNRHDSLLRITAIFGGLLLLAGITLLIVRPKLPIPERFRQASQTSDTAPHSGAIFALAFLKTIFNSRLIVLALAMASVLASYPAGRSRDTIALSLYFLFSMLFLAGIMLYYVLRVEKAEALLRRLSDWLLAHGSLIVGAMFFVLGLILLVRSLPGLG